MPYLALVHLRELRCPECGTVLADPGGRSFIVDEEGTPIAFPDDGAPEEMRVELVCLKGHAVPLFVPNEVSAEEAMLIPEEAPIGADARLMNF